MHGDHDGGQACWILKCLAYLRMTVDHYLFHRIAYLTYTYCLFLDIMCFMTKHGSKTFCRIPLDLRSHLSMFVCVPRQTKRHERSCHLLNTAAHPYK